MSSAKAASNKVVMDAAKKSQDPNTSLKDVATELGLSREILSSARIVLDFGTPEELESIAKGLSGITTTGINIRKRITPEQRAAFIKRGHISSPSDAELWARFKPTIDTLAAMPNVSDMVRIVTSNGGRANYIQSNLEIASNWLKEFMNEWNEYQRVKSPKSTSDTGDGNSTVGV